jgi:DNA-binding transcriptional regulator PaaX
MLTRWRTFPFIDPDLPAALLPKGWLRERAYTLFHDRKDRWIEPARRFVVSCDPVSATARTVDVSASPVSGIP